MSMELRDTAHAMYKSKEVNKCLVYKLDKDGLVDEDGNENFKIEIDREKKTATIQRDKNALKVETLTFDKFDNIIKLECLDLNEKSLDFSVALQYNKFGKCKGEKMWCLDREDNTRYTRNVEIKYDAKGREIEQITKNSFGNSTAITTHEYSEDGSSALVIVTIDNESPSRYNHEYNKEGKITKVSSYMYDYERVVTYDDNGNVLSEKGPLREEKYTYDANNLITSYSREKFNLVMRYL